MYTPCVTKSDDIKVLMKVIKTENLTRFYIKINSSNSDYFVFSTFFILLDSDLCLFPYRNMYVYTHTPIYIYIYIYIYIHTHIYIYIYIYIFDISVYIYCQNISISGNSAEHKYTVYFIRSNMKIKFSFLIGSEEALIKTILESLIHINAFNRMEIDLL